VIKMNALKITIAIIIAITITATLLLSSIALADSNATAISKSEVQGNSGRALAIASAEASNGDSASAVAVAMITVGGETYIASAEASATAFEDGFALARAMAEVIVSDIVKVITNTVAMASNGVASAEANAGKAIKEELKEKEREREKEIIEGNGPFILGSFQENANTHACRIANGNYTSFDLAMLEWYERDFSIYPNKCIPKIVLRSANITYGNGSVEIDYWAWNYDKVPRIARLYITNKEGVVLASEDIHLGIVSGLKKTLNLGLKADEIELKLNNEGE
jgi:hypothetical protein